MFEEFENRITITGTLECTTAIHIGSSNLEFAPNASKNPCIRDSKGSPFIPGSSLKGVLRSFLERYLGTNGHEEFGKSCTITDMCIPIGKQVGTSKNSEIGKQYKNILDDKKSEAEIEKFIAANTCIVCKIFGSQVNGAKMMIQDATVNQNTFNNEFENRDGVSIDRELGVAVGGRLYHVEVIPAGTEFRFCTIIENIDQKEWTCIRLLIKALELEMIKIGGMTSRGLGSIILKNTKASLLTKDNLLSSLLNKDSVSLVDLDTISIDRGEIENV